MSEAEFDHLMIILFPDSFTRLYVAEFLGIKNIDDLCLYACSFVEPWETFQGNNRSIDIDNSIQNLCQNQECLFENLFCLPTQKIRKKTINAFMLWLVYHQYFETYGEFQDICYFDLNTHVIDDLINNKNNKYRLGEDNIEASICFFLEAIEEKHSQISNI